ncbi:MAG: CHAD domain-containing protein [Solirubrobacterales bacterium]|nr:CHAD domain-containing protein [Solirubrobacterales bacterium]
MIPTVPGTSSAYRLEPGAPPVEVIGVIRGRALSAISQLREANPEGQGEAVHEARKDAKKIRAALRLIRGELGEDRFRSENRRFRDGARLLAGMRDTEVMAETVGAMIKRHPETAAQLTPVNRELRARAEQLKQGSGRGDARARLNMAADAFDGGVAVVSAWQLDDHGWDSYGPGLRRTYRDGRRGLRAIERRLRSGPVQEAAGEVHEWRKRVKDLWYQLRLLRDGWKIGLAGLVDETDRLADLLGDFNDLAVLEREMQRSRLTAAQAAQLDRLIAAGESELLDSAVPLGRLIYAEKPSRFSDRIGSYWEA